MATFWDYLAANGWIPNAGERQIDPALTNPLIQNRGPYQSAPNSILGFGQGPPKAYEASNYRYEIPVRVVLEDGTVFNDAIKGNNIPQAVERAYRNWPTSARIIPLSAAQDMMSPGIHGVGGNRMPLE